MIRSSRLLHRGGPGVVAAQPDADEVLAGPQARSRGAAKSARRRIVRVALSPRCGQSSTRSDDETNA
jgi:hypothetical protein